MEKNGYLTAVFLSD